MGGTVVQGCVGVVTAATDCCEGFLYALQYVEATYGAFKVLSGSHQLQ